MTGTILIALVFLVSIVACHVIARRRGSKPAFWAAMAALFGPLAIPFALMSKRKP